MLDKTYRPADVEKRIYETWESSGFFAGGRSERANAMPFTIVIPPPNVTGSLHVGHALDNTLQDVLIRYRRMLGCDTLWQPGTDHAGIATQMVVERQLAEEGKTRHDLGREGFIARVWQWKADSGGSITNQLRRLGASCDWSRERFTMDEGLSAAVRKVFVALFRKGLIYKDKRLVNWDPKLHTAISDLEVEQREVMGKLWTFRYPIEGRDGEFIQVATTRPETMMGDTAIAVHPEDDRYRDLVGMHCILPIVGRRLIIVADQYADPKKGTGAVKITPAHDFNDFEVGRRHGLEMINIFDAEARLNENAPESYRGLDRYVARDKVVAEMKALGLLGGVVENLMVLPYGDRSEVVIEPWLLDQWFVDAATLAKPAIEAVEQGRTVFVPKHWENTYFEWMRNIQPWCISRQIWWGHQIPAWYGPDGKVFVAETKEEAAAEALSHYGHDFELIREPDVLDTWFSSALWPFSTLDWPVEDSLVLDRHYPTDVLVTGFDIIFFWVARMMMMGLHFMKEVPFRTVYIHALVRDEKGQKMSKSKGNAIDPLEISNKYGTDALRFTLTALASQGSDISLSESRIEGYRNFVTKLWNAARYCEMNNCNPVNGFNPDDVTLTVNKWIVEKAAIAVTEVTNAIESYRFNDAASAAYQFTWGTFCDWYLEFTKPILAANDAKNASETRAVTAWVLDRILMLLHPIMPFVTEELWEQLGDKREARLMVTAWPKAEAMPRDANAAAEMDWVVRLVTLIRSIRSEMHVPPRAKVPLMLLNAGPQSTARLATHVDLITQLARLDSAITLAGGPPKGAVQDVLDEATVVMPIADFIDITAEKARLEKEISKLDDELIKFGNKLSNASFIEKAPADVVAEERRRLDEATETRSQLEEAVTRLAAFGAE